jgi:hypothetical protein
MKVHSFICRYNSIIAPSADTNTLHTAARSKVPKRGDRAVVAHDQQLQTNRVQLL